jgi:hypothetical protein
VRKGKVKKSPAMDRRGRHIIRIIPPTANVISEIITNFLEIKIYMFFSARTVAYLLIKLHKS